MADQTQPRSIIALGGIAGNLTIPPVTGPIGAGVAASVVLWSGEMVGFDASGNVVSASSAACVTVVGIARQTADNRGASASPPTTGLAGAIQANILLGPYSVLNDGTVTASTPFGTDLFVVDNQTVSTSDGGGTRLRAGWFIDFDQFNNPVCMFGIASPTARAFGGFSGGGAFRARAVIVTTTVASYTGTGTGTLTFGSNAVVAADGVTIAAGDTVILPAGVLGSLTVTAADAGPYVVSQLGSASAPLILTRPDWWAHGAKINFPPIDAGPEGTLFGGSQWKAFATPGTALVDTTDPALYPGRVTQSVTLVAGTVTVSNVPIRSATKSIVLAELTTPNTATNTVGYGTIAAVTPGALGTASAVVDGIVANQTKNATDVSTINVTIMNW